MIRKLVLTAVVALSTSLLGVSATASENFAFIQQGFDEGASVTGTFTADDLDGNGRIEFTTRRFSFFQGSGELTAFSMNFSGNRSVSPFSLGLNNVFGFVYDLDGGPLGDGVGGSIEGIHADDLVFGTGISANERFFSYVAGPLFLGACDGVNVCGVVGEFRHLVSVTPMILGSSSSTLLIIINPSDLADSGNTAAVASSNIVTAPVLAETVSIQTTTISTVANEAFGNRRGGGASVARFDLGGESGQSAGEGFDLPIGGWTNVSWARIDNSFPTVAFDSDVIAWSGGADILWNDNLVTGLAIGYERQDTTTEFNSGSQDSDNLSFIPYVGYLINDWLSVDGSLGYTRRDIDQSRVLGPLTFDSDLRANRLFAAGNLNAFLERGNWLGSGTLGLLYAKESIASFTEQAEEMPDVEVQNSARSVRLGQLRIGGGLSYFYRGWEPFANAYYVNDFTHTEVGVGAGQAEPSNDDDEVQVSAGLRYTDDEHGVTAELEFLTVQGRDDIDAESVNFLVRIDL